MISTIVVLFKHSWLTYASITEWPVKHQGLFKLSTLEENTHAVQTPSCRSSTKKTRSLQKKQRAVLLEEQQRHPRMRTHTAQSRTVHKSAVQKVVSTITKYTVVRPKT